MNDARHRAGDDRPASRPRRGGTGDTAPSGHQARYRPHVRQAAGPGRGNLSGAWNLPDGAADDAGDEARPLAALVSFHYLRAAVRRRWRVCAVFAFLGLLLGGAYLTYHPAARVATTTLMLVPQDQTNPSGGIGTDISLLKSRTVAQRTINALGLKMSPADLMSSVTATSPDMAEILQISMAAPTDAAAVKRLDKFSEEYLNFRNTIMSKQADVLIKGYQKDIDDLQSQAASLRKEIERLSSSPQTGGQLTEDVTKLSQVNGQISSLQGTVDDQMLQQQATTSASRVIDPAAPESPAGLRHKLMDIISGLIGGLALGFCVVAVRAILSDRLWLRVEVASALKASVIISARKITPLPPLMRMLRGLPWFKAKHAGRAAERQRVARAIEGVVPALGHRPCLAVVCLGNSDEMRFAVAAAAVNLHAQGRMARIVDLSDAGKVASTFAKSAMPADEAPTVFRPSVVPSRTQNPTAIDAGWDDLSLANAKNQTTLVLADFDPAIGLDHLTAWTDSVVVGVTAGKSSVELVSTTGDLVRSAGLDLRGAVLLGAARDDVSSGIATVLGEGSGEVSEPDVTQSESNVGSAGQP